MTWDAEVSFGGARMSASFVPLKCSRQRRSYTVVTIIYWIALYHVHVSGSDISNIWAQKIKFLISNIHFASKFAALSTLQPGTVAQTAPPPPPKPLVPDLFPKNPLTNFIPATLLQQSPFGQRREQAPYVSAANFPTESSLFLCSKPRRSYKNGSTRTNPHHNQRHCSTHAHARTALLRSPFPTNTFAKSCIKIVTERNGDTEELHDPRSDYRHLQIFFFLQNVQTGPVTDTSSYTIGTGFFSWG